MKTFLEKIKKIIFSGKVQGPGSYGFLKIIRLFFKAVKIKGIKPLFAYLHFITAKKQSILSNRPFVMVAYVNSQCNLNCPYCCYGVADGSHLAEKYGVKELLGGCREMSLEDFKKLSGLDIFKDAMALVLSGGEPLLNPDFFKIINYAGGLFPLIHLTTNGTLIGEHIEEIIKSPLTHINISLDAPNAEEYKKMRLKENGEETFNKVVANIKALVKAKKAANSDLEIIISSVVGKLNYDKMDEMAGFAKSLGADSMNFQNICGFNCANLSSQTLYVEDAAIIEYIKNLKNKYSDFHITYPRIASKDKSLRGCCQPFDSMTVDADGNVGPCSVIVPNPNSAYGNLFRDENIWNNKAYQKLRAPLVDGKLPLGSSFCEDCTFLHGGLF